MKIKAKDSSATTREQAPHVIQVPYGDQPSRTNTIVSALTRRAQAILNDASIDSQSRAIIRYALETHDPWLARLVRRLDGGERISESFDFSQPPESSDATSAEEQLGEKTLCEEKLGEESYEEKSCEEKLNALTEIICRAGNDSSAALLVLMATLENSTHPKLLANAAKHLALTRCGDLNLFRMLSAHIAEIDHEACPS
jgi:hypothetical protein